ncbi:MAG: TetR/AcrR family transcriptional regulator [Bacteroidia bacterium]|nr:TetR/AcrR family transcriptional regulator [Bacteroidia bacterium]
MRQNSRKAILDAAFELFSKNGFHSTSIEQIRKKAGVSKGLIYNYFQTKEELMKRVVETQMSQGEEIMAAFMELKDPKKKLKMIVDLSLDYLINRSDHIQLLIGLSIQIHDFPELDEIIKARYQLYMPAFSAVFKELGYKQPEFEAHFLAAYFDGLGLQRIVLGDSLDIDMIQDTLYKKYDLYHLSE